MDTACYYLFSTISQTLAGAFGFLVAVVLYQIQAITGSLGHKLNLVTQHRTFEDPRAFNVAQDGGDWDGIAKCLARSSLPANWDATTRHAHEAHKVDTIRLIEKLSYIKRSLRLSLRFTGITIGLCLMLLILTPKISGTDWLAQLSMGIAFVGALVCLLTYFRLVSDVAR